MQGWKSSSKTFLILFVEFSLHPDRNPFIKCSDKKIKEENNLVSLDVAGL